MRILSSSFLSGARGEFGLIAFFFCSLSTARAINTEVVDRMALRLFLVSVRLGLVVRWWVLVGDGETYDRGSVEDDYEDGY
jgi:hypothetical protein